MMKQGIWLICLTLVLLFTPMTLTTTYTTEISYSQIKLEKKSKKMATVSNHLKLQNSIRNILKKYHLSDANMAELLIGTAAHESHMGKYKKQINGPALGVFQMEPRTIQCIKDNYLKYRPALRRQLEKVSPCILETSFFIDNLEQQVVFAALHYKRTGKAIPADLLGQARIWKKYYNTHLGRGTIEKYLEDYERYVTKKGV